MKPFAQGRFEVHWRVSVILSFCVVASLSLYRAQDTHQEEPERQAPLGRQSRRRLA